MFYRNKISTDLFYKSSKSRITRINHIYFDRMAIIVWLNNEHTNTYTLRFNIFVCNKLINILYISNWLYSDEKWFEIDGYY